MSLENIVDEQPDFNTGNLVNLSELHRWARLYADAGLRVFPCLIDGKEPACPNGCYDGTTDPQTIDKWWGRGSAWNIGIATGEDVGVIDLDVKHVDGIVNWNKLALDHGMPQGSPLTVKTGSGGRHLYWLNPPGLRNSAGKIGPGIDFRGVGGYVLAPPSVVDGKSYEWLSGGDEIEIGFLPELADVPEWVIELYKANKTPRRQAAKDAGDNADRPQAITRFKSYLDKHPIPPEGEGSDEATYKIANRGFDLGLTDKTLVDLIEDATGFEREWIELKLNNAWEYRQNEWGCDIPQIADEKWGPFIENLKAADLSGVNDNETEDSGLSEIARNYVPRDPRNPEDMPEIKFWDDDKTIPNSPDGAVGIIYGKRGEHKTNLVLSKLAHCGASRILYAAGEGAWGVERDRIPARPELKGRIKLIPRIPPFALPEQVQGFIEGVNSIGYVPDIVVLDTMATALAGEDEQTAVTASYLTDNGPCGLIKRAWNCTVILVAHAGKDASKGVRGSSGFEGNVDFVELVEADKAHSAIKTTVTKMRDGQDQFSTHWKYEPVGVPVPVKISKAEYAKLTASAPDAAKSLFADQVASYLRCNQHHTFGTGLETGEFAALLTQDQLGPRPEDVSERAGWDTIKLDFEKQLRNGRSKAWGKKLAASQVEPGSDGSKTALRWFSAPVDEAAIAIEDW